GGHRPSGRTAGDRRGQRGHRRLRRPSARSLRGVPVRDRHPEADRSHLEARVLRGRLGLGRAPGGIASPRLTGPPAMDRRGLPPRDPTSTLLTAVRTAVAGAAPIPAGARVLVAVSGGPDSVALFHALSTLAPERDWRLRACHVHHGLRLEADDDARFVERLASDLGWPVTVERIVVPSGAGLSPEASARAARYAAPGRAARSSAAARVALGHTADDQAETVLMRLLQGAGPRGLSGIPPRRGRLVRPLLGVERATVLGYLAAHALRWVEAVTNRDPKFLRTRTRAEVLPLLGAHVGPPLGEALGRTARAARETVEALDALVAPRLDGRLHPTVGGVTLDLA